MAKRKTLLIRDIRYFDRGSAMPSGANSTAEAGRFKLPKSVHPLGRRIADKLREYGLPAPLDRSHIYVVLAGDLAKNQMVSSPAYYAAWALEVVIGASPREFNRLPPSGRVDFVAAATFRTLRHLYRANRRHLALIDRVEREIAERGEALEILCRRKETTRYRITITYQEFSSPWRIVTWIECLDKLTGRRGKQMLLRPRHDIELAYLIGSIVVKQGRIEVRRRPSYRAKLWTKKIKTPLVVPINKLLAKGVDGTNRT